MTHGLVAVLFAAFTGCNTAPSGMTDAPSDSPTGQRALPLKPSSKSAAAAAGGFVSSVDHRGAPTFIWAVGAHHAEPADDARTAAFRHLSRFSGAHGLKPHELETADLRFVRQLRRGGVIAKWGQKIGGIEVYPSQAAVVMKQNLDLVAVSGHLHNTNIDLPKGTAVQEISAAEALASTLSRHLLTELSAGDVVDNRQGRGELRYFVLAPQVTNAHLSMPALVKRIYFAGGDSLEPAYFIEFYAGRSEQLDTDAFRYVISANDGRILEMRDLVAYEEFNYRVWADADGRPADSPLADFTPHPTGLPDRSTFPFVAPTLITMEGFNTNPDGNIDPWLDSGASETSGNNVDAYTDHQAPDGYTNGDIRATVSSARTFDYVFDFGVDAIANEDQQMASVTSLFYVTNWLHDYYYDSGFDEAAGNAQHDNFGRGGEGGDVLHAEAQDNVLGGSRNNANMSTPSDGLSPRMQMFQWTGNENAYITLTPPGTNTPAGTAAFGPRDINVTAPIVLANDGVGPNNNDGCSPFGGVTGRIALVDRGNCNFTVKAANAQAAGAVGVIIGNNAPTTSPPGLGGADPSIIIGVLSLTQQDANALKTALSAGTVTGTLFRRVDLDRDGSFDHMVVAHEWGHYLHHRLALCGTLQCRGMSEGWGDFNSLFMSIREGDNYGGVYASGTWATLTGDNAAYFGIRRVPYSVDMTKNALSFRHIQDGEPLPTHPIEPGGVNSEVHNTGEVWSTMMMEAYVALLGLTDGGPGAPSFDEVQRRMADYVVTGLQLHPAEATFTEARDAILAAAAASDPVDMSIMASAFARRGAGSCAVSPPRDTEDNTGVTESSDLRARILLGNISFDESLRSCDNDGVLDADERGRLLIEVSNASAVDMANLQISVSSGSLGVLFPAGATVTVPRISPFSTEVVQLELGLAPTLTATTALIFAVRADNADSCEPTVTSTVIQRVNFDSVGGSRFDDVESDRLAFSINGESSDLVWSRDAVEPLEHAWHGIDLGANSDTNLESPSLVVSATEPFVIEFDHRYSFEASNVFWDGGVFEISRNDGQGWEDISNYLDPGYGGELDDSSGNPLALRQAFVATSSAWPDRHHVAFDLGSAFAGETVRFRFRIGTDANTGDYGWEIDNILVSGIDNAPFNIIVADASECPIPLIAEAGADQTVDPRAVVFVDGSASSSWVNLPLTYNWSQVSGPAVSMIGADGVRAVFTAPETGAAATVRLLLTVSDGTLTATDSVDIHINESAALTADAGEDQTVAARAVVLLDGSGSGTAASLPLTYSWAQTAGPTVTLSSGTAVVARFDAPALTADTTFSFTLTVSDGTRVATDSVDVTVLAVGPLAANAGPDQTVDGGERVVLDGSNSMSAAGLPLTFTWTQSDGTMVQINNANTAVARFTAPETQAEMTLTFMVTVTDGTHTQTDEVEVTVRAAVTGELSAEAGTNQNVGAGATVLLDGSASSSSANLPLTYAWLQMGGPAVTLSNPTGVATQFTAPRLAEGATLIFELRVSDGAQMATDTVTINVAKAPPAEDEGGCGCSTSEQSGEEASLLLSFAALALLVFRKKR